MNKPLPKRSGDFATNCIFLLLGMIGLFFAPQLSLQLQPSPNTNTLTVSFSYPKASPHVIEQEVTSKLESVFSGMKTLQSIQSVSSEGNGQIELVYDEHQSVEKIRFEISSRIRQVFPNLPEQVSYPKVTYQSVFKQSQDLLVYALIGEDPPLQRQQFAKEQLLPQLATIKGIDNIKVYGARPKQWKVAYDQQQLQQLDIKPEEIATAISNSQLTRELGTASSPQYLQLTGPTTASVDWNHIPLSKRNGRILYLNDVAKVSLESQPASTFHRINGLEVINMVIKAKPGANQLTLAQQVRQKMKQLEAQQAGRHQFIVASDSTQFLRNELRRIAICTLAALGILLAFVLLASRSLKYTSAIFIIVLVNINIAFLFYYGLGIPLHLYSLIGITVSLGIVIDNSIVMLDHLSKGYSRQIFLAILAATLTSIGAIALIFFLDASQREALSDFALVFSINLLISLFISLFFTPALFRSLSLAKTKPIRRSKPLRRLAKVKRFYGSYIGFAHRFRGLAVVALVLLFGLPIFLLPSRMHGNSNWEQRYNATLGSRFYSNKIKPIVDVALGGSLRLFLDDPTRFSENKLKRRVALHVNIKLPEGHTADQMNAVVKRMEHFILSYEGVEQIQASVDGAQQGGLVVYFEKEAEKSGMPLTLKRELLGEVHQIGSADFEIFGVGKGFDNEIEGDALNKHILLNGYHYESLKKYAVQLEQELLRNSRVDRVYINSRPSFYAGKAKERYFSRPASEQLAHANIQLEDLAKVMQERSIQQKGGLSVYSEGQLIPVKVEAAQTADLQQWELIHQAIALDSTGYTRLQHLTSIKTKKGYEDIVRKNQQYQMVVGYNYLGQPGLGGKLHKENIQALRSQLPIGYTAKDPKMGFWEEDDKSRRIFITILLAIAMVFVISSILFNSIRQPLLAISSIPFSFIGLFLSTYYFDFNFDQGGYAAFLLLSGLSVNAVFFIVNDFNHLKKTKAHLPDITLYLKAFNAKIIPITLMVLSTVLGLIPFLLFDQKQPFWYALAICTIGGLLFSMIGLLLCLPLFFNFKKNQKIDFDG